MMKMKIFRDPVFFRYKLIPLLCATVAISQMCLSLTTPLTSWKGGGFGMYANQDSRDMRGLTIQAITNDGQKVNINTYSSMILALGDDDQRLPIKPSERVLRDLGEKLLEYTFVPTDPPYEIRYIPKIMRDNRNKDLSIFQERVSLPFYDPITPDEEKVLPYRKVKIQDVQLQMWKLKFFANQSRVEAETLLPLVKVTK